MHNLPFWGWIEEVRWYEGFTGSWVLGEGADIRTGLWFNTAFVFCIYYLQNRSTNHAHASTHLYVSLNELFCLHLRCYSVPVKLSTVTFFSCWCHWQTVGSRKDEWALTEVEYLIVCAVIHLVVTIWVNNKGTYLGCFFICHQISVKLFMQRSAKWVSESI